MREKKVSARRLSIVRWPLALAALAALGCAAARAQTPSPSPARTTVDGEEMIHGNYEIVSSLEVGLRGVEIDGNRQKYFSDVNYRPGFRLFDSSILARSRERTGTLFDTLLVSSAGWDADPSGRIRVNVEKDRFYKFDANFRRNAYDNFVSCCNFAQIRQVGPLAGTGLGSHRARVKHKIGDFDLRLLPQNRNFRAQLGYSMDRWRGPGTSTISYARDDFALQINPWRSRSDEVRGGFESKIGKLDLNFTQGYRWYADDSTFVSGPNEGTALPPGNISALTSYSRTQPSRGRAWYSRLSAHTQFDNRFDITARYVFTNSRTRFNLVENITGRGNLENQNVNIDLNRVTASSDSVERPSHLFDLGFTWTATRRLRVSDTFRYQTLNIEGVMEYTDLRVLRRISGTPPLPSPIVITLNPSRELDLRRWQNSLEVDYDFGPRLSVYAGHRYIDRRLDITKRQRVYPVNQTGPAGSFPANALAFAEDEHAENSTNGFFAGFKAKPTKNWSIFFDANRGTSDNAFTRIDYYDTISTRVRSRWALRRGLNLSASFITRDNNNPGVADESLLDVADFDVDISSRTFTSALDWSSNERVHLNAGYTYQHLTSDIGIIFNPGATNPAAGIGRAQYYLRDHYFFFNTLLRVHDRLSLYAGYSGHKDRGQGDRVTNDAAGLFIRSLPMRFQTPEVRAVIRLNRSLDWTLGYQYWDYKEDLQGRFPDLFVNQNYRAHLPYASLRFYFGRRE